MNAFLQWERCVDIQTVTGVDVDRAHPLDSTPRYRGRTCEVLLYELKAEHTPVHGDQFDLFVGEHARYELSNGKGGQADLI